MCMAGIGSRPPLPLNTSTASLWIGHEGWSYIYVLPTPSGGNLPNGKVYFHKELGCTHKYILNHWILPQSNTIHPFIAGQCLLLLVYILPTAACTDVELPQWDCSEAYLDDSRWLEWDFQRLCPHRESYAQPSTPSYWCLVHRGVQKQPKPQVFFLWESTCFPCINKPCLVDLSLTSSIISGLLLLPPPHRLHPSFWEIVCKREKTYAFSNAALTPLPYSAGIVQWWYSADYDECSVRSPLWIFTPFRWWSFWCPIIIHKQLLHS